MKQFYTVVLLLFFINGLASGNEILLPTATMTGNASVCIGAASPLVTFTGTGAAPFTFLYSVNGNNETITTTSGQSVTVPQPTNVANTFVYKLISVTDAGGTPENVSIPNITIKVNPLPIADFTYNSTPQCSGTSIQFTSNVTGTAPYTYEWEFGDGETSTNPNPNHIFNSIGCTTETFEVKLRVKDGNDCTSQWISHNIVVKQKPGVALADVNIFSAFSNCDNSPSVTNPNYTLTVNNISQSSGCIVNYTINWGDGAIQNNLTNASFPITHTYTQLGAFNLVITAVGSNGCTNSKNYAVANQSNPAGGLGTLGSTTNLCAPATVPFTISNWELNSPGTSYVINFGDGESVTLEHPLASNVINHTYTTSSCPNSSFTATLDVINLCDTTPYSAGNIQVRIKPDAVFTAANAACLTQNVCFTNTTISGVTGSNCSPLTQYTWDFGDPSSTSNIVTGAVATPLNACHVFSGPGNYTVSLTALNPCGSDTFTKQICIEAPIIPLFTLSDSAVCINTPIVVTNNTNISGLCNAPNYLWEVTYAATNCGTAPVNIPNQTTANASYSFTVPGTYTIRLIMSNSCGSFNTTRVVVVKQPPLITINTIADICGGNSPSITPTAQVTNCGTQTPTYAWSFPGGLPSSSANPIPGTITYSTTGPKTISLTVTNECGVSTTETRSFTIKTAPVMSVAPLAQTICSGQQTTAIPLTADIPGTTFSWTASATAGITGFIPNGTATTIPIQTITTAQTVAGTVTYTITPTFNDCVGTAIQYIINVNPAPLITAQPASSASCFGSTPPLLSVSFSGGSTSPTFEWYSNTVNSTTGGTLINSAITATYQPSGAVIGTTYYYVKIIFGSGGCSSITSLVATVEVNANPIVTAATLPACSGSAFTFSPVNGGGNTIPAGTTYSWTTPSGTGFTGGSAQSNQASVTQMLTNTTNVPVTAIYTITPKSGTCSGATFQLTVTVNPTPVIAQQTASVCAGTEFTVIPTNAGATIVPTGTLYSWAVPTVNGGMTGGQAGTGQPSIKGTLFNPTSIARTATYLVTPIAPDGNCAGVPFNVVVTVLPTPIIASLPPLAMCSGSTIFTNFSNVPPNVHPSGTTFSWALPAISPAGTITGAISGTDATAFIPTLTNTTTSPATATYTIVPKSGTCIGASFTVEITVNPKATVDPIGNQTLCNGSPTAAIPFSGTVPGTVFNWTNNTTSIGLAASGSGDIPSFQAANTTSVPVVATITVTPVFGICSGTPKTFTITVNPAPTVVFSIPNQVICSGHQSALVNLSSTTAGATFQWDVVTPTGITGVVTAGTDTIPVQTLINNTSAPIIVSYKATASTSGSTSCPGAFSLHTITVNPVPSVTTSQLATVCGGTVFNVQPSDGGGNSVSTATTYSWSTPTGSGFTGGSAQLNQTSISQTLQNTTDVQTTATYQVTPKTGNCNGTPFTVTITLNPTPKMPAQVQQICSGGTFSLTPASVLPNQIVPAGTTYSWAAPVITGGITGGVSGTNETVIGGTLTNSGNTPGTATYTITPQTGSCPGANFTLTVTVNPNPVITTPQQDGICSGATFLVTPADGGGNIVPSNTLYTWTAPTISPAGAISGSSANTVGQNSISQTLINTSTVVATATYTVTPTAGSCIGTAFQVTVTVNPVPTVTAVANQELCNGANTTAINFTGAVPGTLYNWTNSNPTIGLAASGTADILSFTAINTGTTPAIGTITVTPEINGCNGTPISFTITVNPAPSVLFSQPNQVICSAASSVAVNLSSTTAGTTFSWTATIPAGVTGATANGTNTIPVQLLTNTTSSAITIIYTATAATTGVSCPGAPAIYTITVNPVPFVNAPQQTQICSGEQPAFIPPNTSGNNVPTGTTFTWSAPTGSGFTGGSAQPIPQTSFNQILTNTTLLPVTAEYMITPEFNNCPGVTFQLTVTINPKATIPSTVQTICSQGTFTVNPGTIPAAAIPAGTTYTWSTPVVTGGVTGGISGTGTTVTGTLTNPTTTGQTAIYTVTPISPLGNCSGNPFDITVTVRPDLIVTSAVSNYNGFEISTAGANDGFINLTTSGGSGTYTYVWSGPGGFNSTTEDVSNLGPGNYSVTISDGLCNSILLNFQIDEPLPLIIQEVVASHVNLKCFGDTDGVIEVQITQVSIAPFDYVIKIQGGAVVESVVDSNAINYVFDNLAAGIYDISVTDANGTVKQLLGIVITQPANALVISNAQISNHNGFSITCAGANNGSIDLTINGGTPVYTYIWTGPGTFSATTQDISGLAPGTYTVEVNDTTGICKAFGTYVITEPFPITFASIVSSYNGYEISCFGYNDGSIDIQPSGGTGNFTYLWSGPNGFSATTQDISGLTAGTYNVVITDTNGCINNTGTFILNQPTPLQITQMHVDILCFGAATGSIDATVTGGNPIEITPGVFGYNYSWSGPNGYTATTQDISNIPAGNYILTVTDVSGCSQSLPVTLVQPTDINIAFITTPITCYGDDNATITVTLSGGTAPYTVAWSDFGGGLFRDNLGAGNYGITVTDASNCVKFLNINIPQAPLFTINPLVKQITCFGADDASINLNFAGGVPPINFAWTDSATAGIIRNNLGPGTYTVNISDGQPCSISRTFIIVEPQPLVLSANITHAFDCNNANSGAINLLVSGGTPPFVYSWSNGAVTEDLSAIPAGNYQITVTDGSNCIKTAQYSINRQPPLLANVKTETDFDCETKFVKQTFIADISGGVPPYNLSWSSGTISGSNNEIMETNTNGAVILNVTDSLGCPANYSFNVDIPELGTPSFNPESFAFSTYGIYSIVDPIQFTNTATGDYVSIAWDFGDGSVSTEENPVHSYLREGDYVVVQTVTYPLGCIYKHIITLMVDKGYELMMPSGFTPNNDVINDNFSPVFKGLKSVRLDVYNTWGEMIYSEEGATLKGWDGTIKGRDVENGNYYFKVSALTFYGTAITKDGPFTLIK